MRQPLRLCNYHRAKHGFHLPKIAGNTALQALLQAIVEGDDLFGRAAFLQRARQRWAEGGAKKACMLSGQYFRILMLLVGFPYWVQTGKDLAMFYQQPLKMARFIERSEEIGPAFWMCGEHDPFAFVGFDNIAWAEKKAMSNYIFQRVSWGEARTPTQVFAISSRLILPPIEVAVFLHIESDQPKFIAAG